MAFPQPSDFDPVGIPVGHIYTNPSNKTKYEWVGTHWEVYCPPGTPNATKDFALSTPSNDEPQEPNEGDFWYDMQNESLNIRSNDQWIATAMNKEQSQTLDDLRDSLYVPEYILGEEENALDVMGIESAYGRNNTNGFYPLNQNGDYIFDSTTTSCYGMMFSNNFTDDYFYPDPNSISESIESLLDDASTGMVTTYFQYRRQNRSDGYLYTPKIKSIRKSGTSLTVMFTSATHVGSTDYIYDLAFGNKRILPTSEILRHKSKTFQGSSNIDIVINQRPSLVSDDVSKMFNYYYKLKNDFSVEHYNNSSKYFFIPSENFSKNYYYTDDFKRTIKRSLTRPTNEISIDGSKINPNKITWRTVNINNKEVDGMLLERDSTTTRYNLSFTIQCKIDYTAAYSEEKEYVYDYEQNSDILIDFAS